MWLGLIRGSRGPRAVITAAVLAAAVAGCGTRLASGEHGRAAQPRPARAVVTATFRLAGIGLGLATGDGAAWLTTGNGVLRIGQRTDRAGQVLSAPGASLTSIAFGAGSLWVKAGAEILRIDPATGRILARIKVLASMISGDALSFGDGALWTTTFAHGTSELARIDPATNGVRVTPLPCAKVFTLAAGTGGVWISQLCAPGFPVLRIDPATGRVTARLAGHGSFWHLAAGDGAVWASDGASVSEIDPATARVTATIALRPRPAGPGDQPAAGSGLLAPAPGVIWVTGAGGRAWWIDPRSHRLAGAGLRTGGEALALAASGTTLWVLTSKGLTRIDLVACARGHCVRPSPAASPATAPAPVWLDSLQMVSAQDGWALAWTRNPADPAPAVLVPVRTVDAGRTWTPVTPAEAKPMLVPDHSSEVLLAASPHRAWLAVTLARSEASYGTRPARTEVFGTGDGGRSWTRSAPIHAPGYAGWLAFTDPGHGWLLQSLGAAMENNPVRLYRTSDGGRTWSLTAASPPGNRAGTSPSGLPAACDKTGIGFATSTSGWLTGACFSLADALLVTRDGGGHWASQPLPVPADACRPDLCFISPPQFFGGTGFLSIDHGANAPYLLVTHDTGATWHAVAVPHAAGPFGTAHFFGAQRGLLIAARSQDAPGQVFYLTTDGGQTWTPVRQGIRFQPGMTADFVSPDAGFAWNTNAAGAPPIYATTDGGRTWTWYLPRLAPASR